MVYKYKGGNYYDFLNRIGYAKELLYLVKVRSITENLENDKTVCCFKVLILPILWHMNLFYRNFVY